MIAAIFPVFDSTDVTILTAIAGAVGGLLWKVWAVVSVWGKESLTWGRSHLDQVVSAHLDMVNTIKSTQVETAHHIGTIHENISGMKTTLNAHSEHLERIEKSHCLTRSVSRHDP